MGKSRSPAEPDTEHLLALVAEGDRDARNRLLDRHRRRLRDLIALRLDPRLAARVAPSDVVQDSLVEADRRLSDYLRDRPMPFYPWLRALALQRLTDLHRRHVRSQKRSVRREEARLPLLTDDSMQDLARRVMGHGSSPSAGLQRRETQERIRAALAALPERDREVLLLRHLEQLSVREMAAVLGVSEGAVKVRHVRALERLRRALGEGTAEEQP
jgi:RNA polymerase sigma-70 factor, ECF subfamily